MTVLSIAALVCEGGCAAPVISISPGQDGEMVPGRAGGFALHRSSPIRGWCLACCMRHGWLADDGKRNSLNDSAVVA